MYDKDRLKELADAASFAGYVLDNRNHIVTDPKQWEAFAQQAKEMLDELKPFIFELRGIEA